MRGGLKDLQMDTMIAKWEIRKIWEDPPPLHLVSCTNIHPIFRHFHHLSLYIKWFWPNLCHTISSLVPNYQFYSIWWWFGRFTKLQNISPSARFPVNDFHSILYISLWDEEDLVSNVLLGKVALPLFLCGGTKKYILKNAKLNEIGK